MPLYLILMFVCLLVFWLAIVFYITFSIAMIRLEKRFNKPLKSLFIVVLGAHVKENGQLSRVLERRVSLAANLYGQNFAPYIVVSGGKGADEPHSEAFAMREALLRLDVPDNAIILEDTSKNTWENLLKTSEVLAEKGLIPLSDQDSTEKCAPLLIVTSLYHLPRAVYIAFQQGWRNISGAGAPSPFHLLILNRGREMLSWIKHFIVYRGKT